MSFRATRYAPIAYLIHLCYFLTNLILCGMLLYVPIKVTGRMADPSRTLTVKQYVKQYVYFTGTLAVKLTGTSIEG